MTSSRAGTIAPFHKPTNIGKLFLAKSLGAAAGLKETAEQIFKDGYAALKSLVKSKFP